MNSLIRIIALSAFSFCAFSYTYAESLDDCRKIIDNNLRLLCYDRLLKSDESIDVTKPEKKPEQIVKTEKLIKETVPTDKKLNNKPENSSPFGLETKRSGNTVISTLKGTFKGWDKDTVFELANGQTWKVHDSGTKPVYRRGINAPQVTIKRGFLNSYKLKVAGVNRSVQVKRVK